MSQKYLEWFKIYGADTITILIITKGHDSIITVSGVTVLNIRTASKHGLYLYQVSRKYIEKFQSDEAAMTSK